MKVLDILNRWLDAFNDHDPGALSSLMTADHVFVDSLGNRVKGAKAMEAGWRGYFAMCPDYWIHQDHALADGETVLLTGEAGGTIHGESWRTPSAWKAVIQNGSVAEWQVFADNKRVYEISGRRQQ